MFILSIETLCNMYMVVYMRQYIQTVTHVLIHVCMPCCAHAIQFHEIWYMMYKVWHVMHYATLFFVVLHVTAVVFCMMPCTLHTIYCNTIPCPVPRIMTTLYYDTSCHQLMQRNATCPFHDKTQYQHQNTVGRNNSATNPGYPLASMSWVAEEFEGRSPSWFAGGMGCSSPPSMQAVPLHSQPNTLSSRKARCKKGTDLFPPTVRRNATTSTTTATNDNDDKC